jgi:tetratricopeptide (TPR) repeat protein
MSDEVDGAPSGSVYEWFHRAQELLATGNADAALQLLYRVKAEDSSTSVLESLGRALFDARRYVEAESVFRELCELAPSDDFAHYGLGVSLWRLQEFTLARDELAMAFVMRPDRSEYGKALGQVRATLRARADGGLPANGPISGVGHGNDASPVITFRVEDA